jgi:hypothetical protein
LKKEVYPICPAAQKYVENRHGFYEKHYQPRENCTVFELPDFLEVQ